MQASEAKIYLSTGAVEKVILESDGLGWIILFKLPSSIKDDNLVKLQTARGDIRIFRNSETAFKFARSLGIKKIEVIL